MIANYCEIWGATNEPCRRQSCKICVAARLKRDLPIEPCSADHCPGPHKALDRLRPTWYLRCMFALTRLSARMGPEVLVVTKAVLHIVCHLFNLPHPEGIL